MGRNDRTPGVPGPSRRRPRRRSAALLTATACLAALLLALGPDAAAKEKLSPLAAGQMNRSDQLGFNWDPNNQGVIRDGTNDCFDGAMNLRVNGGDFRASQPPMQTKDGLEFVLAGAIGDIGITRRVRLDLAKGAARYVEVLHNKSRRAVTVTLEVKSMLGSSCQTVVTDLGRGVLNGALEKRETGVIAVHGGGSRPGVLFQLRTARSKVVPQVSVQNNRTFAFTWVVKIGAGKTAAVLHSVAQRRWNGPPVGKLLQAEFKPFLDRKWAAGLPSAVRGALVNHQGSGGGAAALTKAVAADTQIKEVAQAYDVERGAESVVLIERDKPLKGTVVGETVTVQTRLGEATVDFDEVAILLGGANLGRTMRLYLRDGEVLAGEVVAEGLVFSTKAGLEIPLDPTGIDALFLPATKDDGKIKEAADAFLTQLDGTKLALAKGADGQLDAVTPWGDLVIPLGHVIRIDYMREPVPGLWILLLNGSKLPVTIQGGAMQLNSLRFGAVQVEPGSIAAWNRNRVTVPMTKNEDGEPAGPPTTHARLSGECYLVGHITEERLRADTLAGTTPLQLEQLRRFDRSDDDDGGQPEFDFTLKSGEKLRGRLQERLISLRTPYGMCRAPVLHLHGYRWFEPLPEPEPDAKPGEEAAANGTDDEPPKQEPAKDAPPKDGPAKGAAIEAAPKQPAPEGKQADPKKADPKQAAPKKAPPEKPTAKGSK